MANFEIPDEHSEVLIKYLNFSVESKEVFLEGLKNAEIGITVSELISKGELHLPDKKEIIPELMDAVISMLVTASHVKDDEIISVLQSSICDKDSSLDKNYVKSEINRLLNVNKRLILSVKGEQLAFNRERLLSETRILTDIRPVFAENGNEEIKASVLMHTLRLTFYHNNNKSIEYVALDETDLESLKVQIERAQNKRKSIEEMLDKVNVKLIKY